MNPQERLEDAKTRAATLADEIDEIRQVENPTDEQVERLDAALAEAEVLADEIRAAQEAVETAERREQALTEIRTAAKRPENREAGASFNVIREADDPYDLSRMSWNAPQKEFVERAVRAIGESSLTDDGDEKTEAERKAKKVKGAAEHILMTGSEDYARAWFKITTGQAHLLEPEETGALRRADEIARSLNIATDAAGKYFTPAFLDPSVIITQAGTVNPWRQIADVTSIAGTNVWTGISSAGVSADYLAEFAAASDNAPVFQQPSVTCQKLAAFVPISFEAYEDIANIQSEVVKMFQDAKDRKEEAEFAIGTGTATTIKGIVTAQVGAANNVLMATNSAYTVTDLYSAYETLGPRWRRNAEFVMNLKYLDRTRRFGGTDVYHAYTVDLTAGGIPTLLGKPVYESFSVTGGLTGAVTNHAIVYGDVGEAYKIVDRIGSTVEFIPQLFSGTNTGTNSFAPPVGARGWFFHWRVGGNAVNTNAYVLLSNPGI